MTIILAALIFFSVLPAQPLPAREVAAQVEKKLLAPCCYSQVVEDHGSAEAQEMRGQIENLAASGESEEQIIAHFKQIYGERILVLPDGNTGRVLFAFPLLAVVFGSAAFYSRWRRMVRAGAEGTPQFNSGELERLRKRFGAAIENDLRELT